MRQRLFLVGLLTGLVPLAYGQHDFARLTQRAEELYRLGDFEGALLAYDSLAVRAPGHAIVLYGRGRTYFALERFARAIADFDSCLAYDNRYAQAYHYRGMARLALGELPAAETDLDHALALDSTLWEARVN
ncbi:MAG: tetratricopeptide repeat protein, partial [Bacteroidia bacterium]|nr:tetratricopeptide repeat protein [Bacteroidia bacterium]